VVVRVGAETLILVVVQEVQEEGAVATRAQGTAVLALKVVQVALVLTTGDILLELVGVVSGRQARMDQVVLEETVVTDISCPSIPSCLHGLQAEEPVHRR
jgi:hypothetical protein